jgi:hypothetical protein
VVIQISIANAVENTYDIDNVAFARRAPGERVGELVVSTRAVTLDFNILVARPVAIAGLVAGLCLMSQKRLHGMRGSFEGELSSKHNLGLQSFSVQDLLDRAHNAL